MALHLFTWSFCSQELHVEGNSSMTTAFRSLQGSGGTAEGPGMGTLVAQIQILLYPAYLRAALLLLEVCPCRPVTPPACLGPG